MTPWVVAAMVVVLVIVGLKFVSKLFSLVPLALVILFIVSWLVSRGG